MQETIGYRAKIGAIAPMTNTVVEHDINMLKPDGVTFHYGRAQLQNIPIDSDEAFEKVILSINDGTARVMPDVLACQPDFVLLAQSIESFWDGAAGAKKFLEWAEGLTDGVGVTTGAYSTLAALRQFPDVKRVACVSPYFEAGNAHVQRFFEDYGYEVVDFVGLMAPSAVAMSQISSSQLQEVLEGFNRPEIDAVVQLGTNVSMVRLADEAERWLHKPVIAINAASVWHTLRTLDIQDQFDGYGSLFRSH